MNHIKTLSLVFLYLMSWQQYTTYCQAQLAEPAKVTESEIELGNKLLQNYVANRVKVKRFACAMLVDETVEVEAGTTHGFDWFFRSEDLDLKILRQDALVFNIAVGGSRGQIGLVEREAPSTIFVTESEVVHVSDVMTNSSVKFANAKEEDFEGFPRHVFTNPWALPFFGTVGVKASQKPRRYPFKDEVEDLVERCDVTSVEQVGNFTGVEYSMAGKLPLSMRMVFDARYGDMPVKVEFLIQAEKLQGKMRVVETEWFLNKSRWLPKKIYMENRLGNPKQPSGVITHTCQLNWVVDESVSPDVFNYEAGHVMRCVDLKEGILEIAVNRE